jgi:hypothetical protein
MTNNRKATPAEIRKHFEQMDCEVHISRDGRVTYRHIGTTVWHEGRYVEEYHIVEGSVVHA